MTRSRSLPPLFSLPTNGPNGRRRLTSLRLPQEPPEAAVGQDGPASGRHRSHAFWIHAKARADAAGIAPNPVRQFDAFLHA